MAGDISDSVAPARNRHFNREDGRVVLEPDLLDHFERPQGPAHHREPGRPKAEYLASARVLHCLPGLTELLPELRRRRLPERLVSPPVNGHLVPRLRDLSYETRVSFGHHAQYEERSANMVTREELQDAGGLPDHRIRYGKVIVDVGLRPVLHIDCESVAYFVRQ